MRKITEVRESIITLGYHGQCQECGQDVVWLKPNGLYCRPACAQKAKRERRKARAKLAR